MGTRKLRKKKPQDPNWWLLALGGILFVILVELGRKLW